MQTSSLWRRRITGAHAFLHIAQAHAGGVLFAQKVRHQRVHSRRGEQYGGVVFGYERGGGDNLMAPFFKEFQVQRPELIGSKVLHMYRISP